MIINRTLDLLPLLQKKSNLYSLTSYEIPSFNLMRYLCVGGLPSVYLGEEPYEELAAYTDTYLKDEIQAESLVRNIPGFSRFLHVAALTCGKIVNFSSV